MAEKRLGIIMHGVTGRMGTNQHLIRSICAIREQGGIALADGTRVMPDPVLVGRSADKLERLAKAHGIARWSTDIDAALQATERNLAAAREQDPIRANSQFDTLGLPAFDVALTSLRECMA